MPRGRDVLKRKLDLNFPSFVSIDVLQDNIRVGEFRLSFNCLNDLIMADFRAEPGIDGGVECRLNSFVVHFVLCFPDYVFHNNVLSLKGMVGMMGSRLGDDFLLRLDV